MRKIAGVISIGLFVVLFVAGTAHANYDMLMPSTVGAMGDAGVAASSGSEAAYYNPAAIGVVPDYIIDFASTVRLDGEYYPLGIIISDSLTNQFLAGHLGFVFNNRPDSSDYNLRMAFGIPIVPDMVNIGIGGLWVISDTQSSGVIHRLSLDLGILARPGAGFSIGLAVRNVATYRLLDSSDLAAGIAWENEYFLISAQYQFFYKNPLGDKDYYNGASAGVEARIDWFRARAGYKFCQYDMSNTITFGLGARVRVFEFGVAYSYTLDSDVLPNDTGLRSFLMMNIRLHMAEAQNDPNAMPVDMQGTGEGF